MAQPQAYASAPSRADPDRGLQPRRPQICFLYIAQSHQVLHSISIAVALARNRPDIDVHILTTQEDGLSYARSIVDELGGAPLHWRLLGPAWLRAAHPAGQVPLKLPMLAANVRLLRRFDVIVAPERTTAVLRDFGLRTQKLVYTQHGAGDREGPFEKRLGRFDLVFAAGAKQRDRMIGEGLVAPNACAVVGYPKFEVVDRLHRRPPPRFTRDRPVVLYNPHFSAAISSWPSWGPRILASFAAQDEYNLVFAPHLRLFEGRSAADVGALAAFASAPAIHMDLGTRATVDMTYTTLADIYLGDVSSQIYEFIRRPRPCLFLNAHGVDWRGDESYRHWRFGPVIDEVAPLLESLDGARLSHAAYVDEQRAGLSYTFDMDDRPSSQRAADAILALMEPRSAAVGPPELGQLARNQSAA